MIKTKDISEFFINMVEANPVKGPHRFGPFTDTLLAMAKRAGNTYKSFYKLVGDKVVLERDIPKDLNPVLIIMAPYLADELGTSPFAKAEAEYMFEKMKKNLEAEQYKMGKTMLEAFSTEFTEEQRKEYENYKKMFKNL